MDWISVKDRLPEEGVRVQVWGTPILWDGYQSTPQWLLAYHRRQGLIYGPKPSRRDRKVWLGPKWVLVSGHHHADCADVTHWMSLPEPPEREPMDSQLGKPAPDAPAQEKTL